MSIWEKSGYLGHVHFCVHLNEFFRNGAFLIKNRTVSITYQARHVSNSKRCVLCPKITLFRLRTKPDMSAIRNGVFFVQKSPCFDYVPSQTCHQFETVCFWSKTHRLGIFLSTQRMMYVFAQVHRFIRTYVGVVFLK